MIRSPSVLSPHCPTEHTMINSNIFLLCASWLQNILFYSELNVLLKCFVQFNPPFNCKYRDLQDSWIKGQKLQI